MKLYEYILKFKTSDAEQKLRKLGRATNHTEKQASMLKSAFYGVGTAVAGLAIGAALFSGARAAARLGIEMEQTRVSFTTFLKSADKANASIAQLNEFANVTPFDNAQVLQAGKGLLAFGVAQDKIIPSLRKIGDIAAGSGKDFNELATIYGKAKIAGTLMAEDINQLLDAGIPIMGEFAKALGTTEDQVKKMASQGKLKFKDLENAFTNLTSEGGMFFDLMKSQSETAGGRISTFTGKMQGLGIGIGEAFNPLIAKVFGKLAIVIDASKDKIVAFAKVAATKIQEFIAIAIPYLRLFRDTVKAVWGVITVAFQSSVTWINENIEVIEALGYMVGIAASAYIGYNAVLLVNKAAILAMKVPVMLQAGWTSVLTAKQWLLNIALNANPIGLVVGAIAALIALTVVIIKKYDEWGASLALMLGPFGLIINMVQSFRRHWDSITEAFNKGGIVGGLKRIGQVMLDAVLMPLQQLLELASKLPGSLGEIASSGAIGIENLRKKFDLLPPIEVKVGASSSAVNKLANAATPGQTKAGDLLAPVSDAATTTTDTKLSEGIDNINGGGSKHTNITISMDNLIGEQNFSITNLKESAEEVKKEVEEALLRVVNGLNYSVQ